MEDHGGSLILGVPKWLDGHEEWQNIGGATAVLILPFAKTKTEQAVESKAA